jgi:hypothetical protein
MIGRLRASSNTRFDLRGSKQTGRMSGVVLNNEYIAVPHIRLNGVVNSGGELEHTSAVDRFYVVSSDWYM